MTLRAWIGPLLMGAAVLLAQDELPRHAPGDSFDFEPKLMLDGPFASPAASPTPSADDRVRRLEAALSKAQQRAADSEQFYKEGVLAKVELEARYLRIIEVRKELADARLEVAAANANGAKTVPGSNRAALDSANAALTASRAAAAAASTDWDKAQLSAALLDLERKRKLYSEGVGSRHEVEAAEDRVTLLTGTVPP